MKKTIRFVLAAAVLLFAGYHSIYFKKLSAVRKEAAQQFDAPSFAATLWKEKFPARLDSALKLSTLMKETVTSKEKALQTYTKALAIGNYRYAIVQCSALVQTVNTDDIVLQLTDTEPVLSATLATEYIYGNAIRDASGLVDIKDFPNTTELNAVSEEFNKLVRSQVLPGFKSTLKKGDRLQVTAAIEINQQHMKWDGIELIPLRVLIEK